MKKKLYALLVFILALLCGCGEKNRQAEDIAANEGYMEAEMPTGGSD